MSQSVSPFLTTYCWGASGASGTDIEVPEAWARAGCGTVAPSVSPRAVTAAATAVARIQERRPPEVLIARRRLRSIPYLHRVSGW